MKNLFRTIKNLFERRAPRTVFRLDSPDGYIEIGGSDVFVNRLRDDLARSSPTYRDFFLRMLGKHTREEIAEIVRAAGYDENIIREFNHDRLWSDADESDD